MEQMLGFSGFASTKGQVVPGNDKVGEAAVKKKKKRQYRQYLYVKGSYNIPLTQEDLKDRTERDGKEVKSEKKAPMEKGRKWTVVPNRLTKWIKVAEVIVIINNVQV